MFVAENAPYVRGYSLASRRVILGGMTTVSDLVRIARTRASLPSPDERRRIRREAGVQARQVADAVGVSTATVFDWEQGRREPNDVHLLLYAEVLGALSAATTETA